VFNALRGEQLKGILRFFLTLTIQKYNTKKANAIKAKTIKNGSQSKGILKHPPSSIALASGC
jgi:hypothetical protein